MRALILTVLALFVLAAPTLGQTVDVYISSNPGGGGDLMVSPVVFGGPCTIDYIYSGYWQMTVPDGDWPTEEAAREAYIWDTFFAPNYDAGDHVWFGYLDSEHGLTENCYFELWNYTASSYAHGYSTIVNQVDDADADEFLDSTEGCIGALDGAIIVIQGGSGIYDGLCGFGAYYGSYDKTDCPTDFFSYQDWNFGMYLELDPCGSPVENMSWGTIKALYQ